MALSHLPASLANAFGHLACWLDRRHAARLPVLLLGMLFASERRTITSWFREKWEKWWQFIFTVVSGGRPRGCLANRRPIPIAVAITHDAAPCGRPLTTDLPTAANSPSGMQKEDNAHLRLNRA